MTPPGLRRYRAERLLRKDFSGLRSKVLAIVRSQLRTKGIVLDASDLEACYAQAWHGLYATLLEGETVENPSAWLVLVTFRRAIDESRSASRIVVVEGEEMGSFPRGSHACADGLVDELDNRARLRHVFEGMRASLSERECQAACLCYLQGISRADAAERIGISQARMRKLMDGAGPDRPGVAGKVGSLLDTIKADGWCEQQSSLMRAFAFGILDPEGERHALALAHCRECPACRAHVASLRGLASVLPLPLLSPLALAGAGATGARGVESVGPNTPGAASQAVSTGAGLGPVRPLSPVRPLIWSRPHPGRAAGGWSGLGGSLTVKLAATAVVLIGTGCALLGSRAPGSPPAHRAGGPTAAAPTLLSRTPFSAFTAPTHRAPSTRAPSARGSSTARGHLPRRVHSTRGETSGGEFIPERVRPETATKSSTSTTSAAVPTSSRNPSRAAREFGIE